MTPPKEQHCPICKTSVQPVRASLESYSVPCVRCGHLRMHEDHWEELHAVRFPGNESRIRANISGWLRERSDQARGPIPVTPELVKQLATLNMPRIEGRIDRLLKALDARTDFLGQPVIDTHTEWATSWVARTWSLHFEELLTLLAYSEDAGLVKLDTLETPSEGVTILPAGWKRIEDTFARNAPTIQVFVAMAFTDDLQEAYDIGIDPAIRATGYSPLRIDRKEHANKIDDEIIGEIRRSRFVVADLTHQRQSVYYEAAFGQALNLPVIWTCHKDDLKNTHFDVRQYNCIDWSTPIELRDRLEKRIAAILGRLPIATPK